MDDSKPPFMPIKFSDGTEYSAQEVAWVVEDYLAAAERSISKRRNAARYQMELRGTAKSTEMLPAAVSEKQKFITQVRAANDYNWIVAVAMSRNELDPMHALRVKVLKTDRVGGSTMDIMVKHIDEVMRNINSTYQDRARAMSYMKFISDLSKKGSPAGISFDFSITEATRTSAVANAGPKRVNSDENEKPEEKVNIRHIRAAATAKRK